MKALSSPELPRMRRVPKPVMEKRRRDRINQSLETLRILMLENTHDERLKNPKVEKAEILESVVQFLQTDQEVQQGTQLVKRARSRQQASGRQPEYQEGMRSCLLRISQFMASDPPRSDEPGTHVSAAGRPLPSPDGAPHLLHKPLLTSTSACTRITDPVWRPWPQ